MFSPSLFTKHQMELLFDHSTKSLIEILREAAASANRHRPPSQLGPLSGPEIPRFPESDFKNLGALTVAANRLHHNVLATALANKLARIAWTVLVQARSYEARVN
jgi:hypothetical protein